MELVNHNSETHFGPYQTPMIEPFCEKAVFSRHLFPLKNFSIDI